MSAAVHFDDEPPRRDLKLAKLGYRVLRLEAGLVERALAEALAQVREALGA